MEGGEGGHSRWIGGIVGWRDRTIANQPVSELSPQSTDRPTRHHYPTIPPIYRTSPSRNVTRIAAPTGMQDSKRSPAFAATAPVAAPAAAPITVPLVLLPMICPMIAPAIAPPRTFFLSPLGSPTIFERSSSEVVVTSADIE